MSHRITLNSVANVQGLSCAQIALLAATGRSLQQVNEALLAAAARVNVPLDWKRINAAIWREALALLDFVVLRCDIPEPRQNADQFMAANDHKDVVLVVVQDPSRPGDDHVFATQGRLVVDFYTDGRVESYDSSKNSLRRSRVVHIVHVRGAA